MTTIEPIKETLKRRGEQPNFMAKFEEIRQRTLQDERLQTFFNEHKEHLTDEMIDTALPKLFDYLSQSTTCCGCGSVEKCTNPVQGFIPKLQLSSYAIEVNYEPCEQKIKEDTARATARMINSLHMPKETINATLSSMEIDTHGRVQLANFAADFINAIKEKGKVPDKGLYLWGGFGVGKSFVLGAIANELAAIGVRSVLVYVPEFLREMKQAIDDRTLQEKITFVKEAPVLMLDDLGAETLSSWARDEILGTILHYRMAENLPLFITSNLDYAQMAEHLAGNNRGNIDVIKAARLMERIQATTLPMQLDGNNRR